MAGHISDDDLEPYAMGAVKDEGGLAALEEHLLMCGWCIDRAENTRGYVEVMRAAVICRFHDLRHTALTKMAEAGVPESTMLALAGHVRRAMLERYPHIRMKAKREAVAGLTLATPTFSVGVSTVSTTLADKQDRPGLVTN